MADAVFARGALALRRRAGWRRGSARTSSIATPPIAKFGTARAAGALARAGDPRREDRRAGDHRARRGLRRRRRCARARARVDGGWLVNGAKTYITNGVRADFYVTAVRTRADGGRPRRMSFLVIERGEGVTRDASCEKLGWHASDTAEIAFDDVFVPDEHLLGEEGARLLPDHGQLPVGAAADGARRGRLDAAPGWSARRAAGAARAAGRRSAPRGRGARDAAEAGAALTYHALRRFLDGGDAVREVTMAKLATQRACSSCTTGCSAARPRTRELERAARDSRLGPIGGGSDEIMRRSSDARWASRRPMTDFTRRSGRPTRPTAR